MRIFISAGEPSGDLHGANLISTLRQLRPDVECVGFGGERMTAAGCTLLYPLCRLAVMWFLRVLLNAHVFIRLLVQADRYFKEHKPGAVVLIDYPGFHWWLARRAKARGIPVFYFVPPQLWAWAGWRVRKMRRFVDHVLCSLPFERDWYQARGVAAHYVGHPYFDELPGQKLDEEFVAKRQAATVVGLLPGSRNQEVVKNLSTLVRTAQVIHAQRPDVQFLVACFKESQKQFIDRYLQGRGLPIETHVGRTPEIIQVSRACVAVSGSVGLELLFRGKPSVVVYRIRRFELFVSRWFIKCRFISLVNLLAEEEIFPEFLTHRCEATAIGRQVLSWLNDAKAYVEICERITAVRQRTAEPGACRRAADFILQTLVATSEQPLAA